MSKTDYLEANLINHVLRGIAYPVPVSIWVALFTTAPTEAGGGIEVSGGSYARQQALWTAPAGGSTTNTADVIVPVATANWGVITSFALLDAVVAGNMLYYANLNAPRNVQINDLVKFPTGQLQVTED
jgi:hypothetical protein